MMSEKAKKIKDAFDRQKEIKVHNTSTEDFIEELQSDMLKTLREKYPYIEFAEIPNKLSRIPTAQPISQNHNTATTNISNIKPRIEKSFAIISILSFSLIITKQKDTKD